MQPALTIIALSLWLIVFLGLTCVVFSLISIWEENRFGWPLRGMIWFTVAIAGSCAVIALLAGYVQKARSLEKFSHRVELVTFGWNDHAHHGDHNPSNQRGLSQSLREHRLRQLSYDPGNQSHSRSHGTFRLISCQEAERRQRPATCLSGPTLRRE